MVARPKPKTARGEATRRAILEAAESVIGTAGYNEASIAEITRLAGVAQGTFYIYFKGKEEIFRALVLEMGRRLRGALSDAIEASPNRVAAEREGLRTFLTFVSAHPELYRIVQEALFVDPDAYRTYFQTFADAYRDGLEAAEAAGEIRPGDTEVRAWALMGMAKSLGERAVVWGDKRPIDEVVEAAHDLIVNGLGRG
ncbi:TetR/AcrR family transcriptional regulator [Amorphus coralli]|uniref:TetR/AcrR family transcriptional regulator n=1 Tax=Amorphus coralli TaxID=340680 RepID=UPI000375B482|nr:TetR/AcrR family transcriptional regulator [Amorphus coralli]